MNFGIIGAGPAGIFSALMIKEQDPEHCVTIFDGNQKIGRKLFATGNGRCNITNMNAGPESYYSVRPADLSPVFEQTGPEVIRKKLEMQGLGTFQKQQRHYHPGPA